MNLIVHIPDELASRLETEGDLERQALEALVLESFRSGRITIDELREALGFVVLDQADSFLKARGVFDVYTVEDIDRQVEALVKLGY